MRKFRELRDAIRTAGGLQYVELQNLEAQLAEARASLSAKMELKLSRVKRSTTGTKLKRELQRLSGGL